MSSSTSKYNYPSKYDVIYTPKEDIREFVESQEKHLQNQYIKRTYKTDFETWSVKKCGRFIGSFPFYPQSILRIYTQIVIDNKLDGKTLLTKSASDLQSMGIKNIGHALRICKELEEISKR